MGFQCFVHGLYVGGARAKAFNAEYYTTPEVKALAEEHKKATGEAKLPGNGYPDMGSGRYSSLLPYAKWLAFNNAQRAHGNYVEGLASIVTFTTAAALTFSPLVAARLGAAYIVGREVYAWGYSRGGPNARIYGVAIFDIALLGMLGCAITGGLRVANLIK